MNGWSSYFTIPSRLVACFFFLNTCKLFASKVHSCCPHTSGQLSSLFPLWCALHNKRYSTKCKKRNTIGKNVWFRTHVCLATGRVDVAQKRPRFGLLSEGEILTVVCLLRCQEKCPWHRQEEKGQGGSVVPWSLGQRRKMEYILILFSLLLLLFDI